MPQRASGRVRSPQINPPGMWLPGVLFDFSPPLPYIDGVTEPIQVTRETLREFLSGHSNWAEVAADTFECCLEHGEIPVKIVLFENGADLTFPKGAWGGWRYLAGQTKYAPYATLHWFATGGLAVKIDMELVPPNEQPREPRKPTGSPEMRINLSELKRLAESAGVVTSAPDLRPPE